MLAGVQGPWCSLIQIVFEYILNTYHVGIFIFAEVARAMALSGTYITYMYNIHIVYIYTMYSYLHGGALNYKRYSCIYITYVYHIHIHFMYVFKSCRGLGALWYTQDIHT